MSEHPVMQAAGYDRVDGRNAYQSRIKKITLGQPVLEEHQNMEIAAQLWEETKDGSLAVKTELPIHQVIDLMLFLSRSMLYFRDAYRMPLLYSPENPTVERLGVQGDAMSIEVCVDNPDIDRDILAFSNALSGLGEITGERLRTLGRILEEMDY